jgi:hypothetical protein
MTGLSVSTSCPRGRRPERATPGRWARPVALLLFLAFSGCLFSIRDPDPPVGADIPQHLPLEPDSVLFNFASGFKFKDIGISVLTRALEDTFKFKLDPSVAGPIYGIDNVELTKKEFETGWLAYVDPENIPEAVGIQIEFRTDLAQTPTQSDDEFLYDELPYFVTTIAGSLVDTVAAGQIDLYFRRTSGNWFISRWEDKIREGEPTLGAFIESGSGHPR